MIWTKADGKIAKGFRLPLSVHRSVDCPAYEANGRCKYYGYGYIEGGWEGSVCFHPRAVGNKAGWLTHCPKRPPVRLQDALETAFESRPD